MGYGQLSVLLLIVFLCQIAFSSSLCLKDESISLLKFKNLLTVGLPNDICLSSYTKTTSWNMSRDCCFWDEVKCNEMTNHVIELDLSCNQLIGVIDSNSSLFQLSHLQRIHLFGNNFSGSDISHKFGRFSILMYLDLSTSYFSGQIPSEISRLSKLQSLHLASDFEGLYGIIPESIFHLSNLEILDLSNNDQLSGSFPKTKWNSSTSLMMLDLSYVNFYDNFPDSFGYLILMGSLTLQYCNIWGPIPSWMFSLSSLRLLNLRNKHFSGQLEDFNAHVDVSLFSDLKNLTDLDLSYNSISLTNEKEVEFIFPESLEILRLSGCESNFLQGSLPIPPNSTTIFFISENNLGEEIPSFICNLMSLKILDLARNNLKGVIPQCLELRIIDLSYNAFMGKLPTSLFQRLKAMRIIDQPMKAPSDGYYQDSVTIVTKGSEREIVRILYLYTTIDPSNNRFEGRIPSNMGDLIALRLSREIPQQLASLTFLAFLNLSHNHLQGCISQGLQFYTFESNSYESNDGLRGFPISEGCGHDRVSETNYTLPALDDEENNSEFLNDFWKAALMGYVNGLCIGLSIIYFMVSTGNSKWLARIIKELEHRIIMRRRKKQQRQRNYRRRNNHF
ncbi:receptor-like protein 9DC1 [Lycium barbarum]|uniref:receptor-like protein 9DC1 n=1 Tax=Lycium barbarum TaxID=112863 RepID=UPI00293E47B6|nr:receptor-like protein 9DC1 [Lycium barbarum]